MWSRGHRARGLCQEQKKNPRPRADFPRTDPLEAHDMNTRGQGQGPRIQPANVFKNKKSSRKKIANYPRNFRRFPINLNNKKVLINFLRGFWRAPRRRKKSGHDFSQFSTNQKILLFSAEDRAFSRTCQLRGQGLDLRGQGQRLQIVPSRTFSKTLPLAFKATGKVCDVHYCKSYTLLLKTLNIF